MAVTTVDLLIYEVVGTDPAGRMKPQELCDVLLEAVSQSDVVAFGSEHDGPMWVARYPNEEEWPPQLDVIFSTSSGRNWTAEGG